MQIVFVLLAHNAASLVARVARTMTATGHRMVIHYDAKVPDAEFAALEAALSGLGDRVRFARRVRVGWGEWSVVRATLNAVEAIAEAGWAPDYVYLMSAMDYPTRSATELDGFLDRNRGDEFIESVPSDTVKWVKSGPQRERYQYRWYSNWRERPRLTDWAFRLQRRLGLKRRFVADMVPHLGSQWWVLTWPTLQAVMEIARRPDVLAFFRTTLVPDELFFQDAGAPGRARPPHHQLPADALPVHRLRLPGGLPRRPPRLPDAPALLHGAEAVVARHGAARPARPLLARRRPRQGVHRRGRGPALHRIRRLAPGPPRRAAEPAAGGRGRARLGGEPADRQALLRVCSAPARRSSASPTASCRAPWASGCTASCSTPPPSSSPTGRSPSRPTARPTSRCATCRASTSSPTWCGPSPSVRPASCCAPNRGGPSPRSWRGGPTCAWRSSAGTRWWPSPRCSAARTRRWARPFDPAALAEVPPEAAANRFRVFLKGFGSQGSASERRFKAAVEARPKGWAQKFDPRRIGPDWLNRLETCLGVRIDITPEALDVLRVAAVDDYRARRRGVIDLLVRGGIDPVVFDVLGQGGGGQGGGEVSNALALL